MPEVQKVGTIDYAMPAAPQYSNEQLQDNIPAIYDAEMETRKKAASGKVGLTLLGMAIAAGLGIIGGRAMGGDKSILKEENKALKEMANELNTEAKKYTDDFFARHKNSKKFVTAVEEKTRPFVEEAETTIKDTAEEIKEEAKEVAEDAAKA